MIVGPIERRQKYGYPVLAITPPDWLNQLSTVLGELDREEARQNKEAMAKARRQRGMD